MENTIPWVEKYRPDNFDNIILDDMTKKILSNIVLTNRFPNILFYGPPGTGKTTTIMNLINFYQSYHNQENKSLVIHLNASDERGVDIVRNQLLNFSNSKGFYNNGVKFIILDEVDYMTKNAQHGLKYLLQTTSSNVRVCLICNYISKIDESLRNEFITIRFNQLPEHSVFKFINNISKEEKLGLKPDKIKSIIKFYNSDIRSMINYLQSNQDLLEKVKILDAKILDSIYQKVKTQSVSLIIKHINKISITYGVNTKNLIISFFNYIISSYPSVVSSKLLNLMEFITHHANNDCLYVEYTFTKLKNIFSEQ